MTLSESDLLQWQNLFTIQLPFRKLKKLMLSLPLNVWYKQLRVDGLLPAGCLGVRDLLLYDIDEHWKSIHSTWSLQTSMHGFSSFSYARLQHTIAMFKQVASSFVVGIDQQARLQDVWLRYGYVLEQGFGLQSAGTDYLMYAQMENCFILLCWCFSVLGMAYLGPDHSLECACKTHQQAWTLDLCR